MRINDPLRKSLRTTCIGLALVACVSKGECEETAKRVARTATEIRARIDSWLKPDSRFHDLTDNEVLDRFPEMRFPHPEHIVTVHRRHADVVKIAMDAGPNLGVGHIFRVVENEETTVEIFFEKDDHVLGRIVPSEHARLVEVGATLRPTEDRIRAVEWPPKKISTKILGGANGDRVAIHPDIQDARLKEVLFSMHSDGNDRHLGVVEILQTGSADPLVSGTVLRFIKQHAPIEKGTRVYLVAIPASAMPPVKQD